MKQQILNTLKQKFESEIAIHKMNIVVLLENPTAIHDHQDYISAVETEVEKYTHAKDKLESIEKIYKEII